ncbi:recombinase family protein [Candidatus Uhrbacteria bacterium]|nr:recombinase family protein [Candidatus Uhrbacteria bacterium]
MNYFLYIRKSTDEDDRQVLSLEAQETELREFAVREKLQIVEVFRESQTAKAPGRPIFNAMLDRIEHDEAQGILCWHPDRLARNSIDGGKIIYFIDTGKIVSLKSPCFWFEPTPQGKFMLSIAFGQSKYFVDNLSENTKRGLRQKLRRGELPGYAPLGYLNDLRAHNMIPDPERVRPVQKIFELYSSGDYSLYDIRDRMTSAGVRSKAGKMLSVSNIQRILSNPFYYGVFRYNGEMYEGTHEPIITKKLFEACQRVMAQKSRPKKRQKITDVFRGLFLCNECECAITSEKQKGHTYYRCTKMRGKCSQPYVREEALGDQIAETLQKVSIPKDWSESMIAELEREKEDDELCHKEVTQNLKKEIEGIQEKLDVLLDAHLESTISRDEYIAKKHKILNKKVELTEKVKDFERRGDATLEPITQFIFRANQAETVALQRNFSEMKNFLKNLHSNRRLAERRAVVEFEGAWKILFDFNTNSDSWREEFRNTKGPKGADCDQYTTWLRGWDSNPRPIDYM